MLLSGAVNIVDWGNFYGYKLAFWIASYFAIDRLKYRITIRRSFALLKMTVILE